MTSQELQTQTFERLEALGFRPARSLPLPDLNRPVRPAKEIAARLFALAVLVHWVAASEEDAPTDLLETSIDRNSIRGWLTEDECAIIDLPRSEAREQHMGTIGWYLENMWPLAWTLGFEPEPDLAGSQIQDEVTHALVRDFIPSVTGPMITLLAKAKPRGDIDIRALEYLFYCAHNAVRSAQLGGDTVPEGFHPVYHGGAIHERRHALTWCISPDDAWDETDLST